MRTISYIVLGGMGGEFPKRGTVADLLLEIPYLLTARIIPPLHVINDLLAKGLDDAGMSGGCQWEPLQITESDWDDLVLQLKSLPGDEACEFVRPPDWVETVADWWAWIMIHKHGMPEEFRLIEREVRELEHARQKALNEGNEDLVLELHLRAIEASNRLSQLVVDHRDKTSKSTGDDTPA